MSELVEKAVRPTPERAQHGPIEIADRPVKGRANEHTAPAIALDVLQSMHRRGAITTEERLAGERFRAWFRLAQLDSLRAADLGRTKVDGVAVAPEIGFQSERARREIRKAIRFVGGYASSQGQCLWHVLGLEESVREWARGREQKTTNLNAAGIIAVTLERLALMSWTGPGEKSS